MICLYIFVNDPSRPTNIALLLMASLSDLLEYFRRNRGHALPSNVRPFRFSVSFRCAKEHLVFEKNFYFWSRTAIFEEKGKKVLSSNCYYYYYDLFHFLLE